MEQRKCKHVHLRIIVLKKHKLYHVHKVHVTFLSPHILSDLKKSEQTKLGRLGVGGRDKCDGGGK